jgi:hypothetical protein
VVSFGAWTTQLILAGYGPNSVFSVTPAPTGGGAVLWFGALVPIGATLYWFVRRVRTPLASLIVGLILVALSGLSLIAVLTGLPGADKDGMLYMVQYWPFAIVLWIIVAVPVGISKDRDRKALRVPVRPDQPPPDMPPPTVAVSPVKRRHRDVLGMFIKFVVAAGLVFLLWYIWALTQIEF